jgi:flagellar hook assembly protein FlgD
VVLTATPNPSVTAVQIGWTIIADPGQQANARLDVLDSQGRRVRTLADHPAAAGFHQSFWDGRDEHGHSPRAGVYWVRLAYGDRVVSRRLVRMATPQ